MLFGDPCEIRERFPQCAALGVGIDMWEIQITECFTNNWQRSVRIFICIEFDNLRRVPPDARGQNFKWLNRCIWGQRLQMLAYFHTDLSILNNAALACASKPSASASAAAVGPIARAVFSSSAIKLTIFTKSHTLSGEAK